MKTPTSENKEKIEYEPLPSPNCCKTLWSRVAVKPLMTRTEVAEYLGVSTQTIRRYEENGLLPRIDLSRTSIRYRPEAVEHLLDELTRKKATFRMY